MLTKQRIEKIKQLKRDQKCKYQENSPSESNSSMGMPKFVTAFSAVSLSL